MSVSHMTYWRQMLKHISYKGLKLSTYWTLSVLKIQKSTSLKIFFTNLGIAWKVEHGLELLCSSLRSPEMQIFEVVPVPEFAVNWSCITSVFLFPEIVRLLHIPLRLKCQVGAKHPFKDMSNSQQKLVASVKNNTECILNILAWEEPRCYLLATGSCKCLVQWFFLLGLGLRFWCHYDNTGVFLTQPAVSCLSRRLAGHITGVSLERGKNGGGLEKVG